MYELRPIALPTGFAEFVPVLTVPDAPYNLAQKLRVAGLIPHEGIVYRLNFNDYTWQWDVTIAHFSKTGHGVLLSTLEEFRDGNQAYVTESPSSPPHTATIIENINDALRSQAINGPAPYDVDRQNCQHFTSWAYGYEPKSESATAVKTVLGIGALIFFLGNLGE